MTKQELIDELKRHLTQMSEIKGSQYCKGCEYATKLHLAMIADLDEPEKPVVPQFVADWYEEHKDNFEIYLSGLCINFTCHRERLNDKLANWYEQLENKPMQTLVNMHQFGYEVQKEKLYTVEIPNPTSSTPQHYQGTIQPIDLINAQDLNFNLGNVVKYVCRAGKKQGENILSDLEKAKNYINYEIERIKKNE